MAQWLASGCGHQSRDGEVRVERVRDTTSATLQGRHNLRRLDTIEQMERMAANMEGKRLTYKRMIEDNEQPV